MGFAEQVLGAVEQSNLGRKGKGLAETGWVHLVQGDSLGRQGLEGNSRYKKQNKTHNLSFTVSHSV
jgi:hypothetical protein